jgi:hypothetical protein
MPWSDKSSYTDKQDRRVDPVPDSLAPTRVCEGEAGPRERAPAIRRRPGPRPTLLVFDIAGKITRPDIEDMARQIDQAFDAWDRIDILLIMSDFEGLDAGAVFDGEALGAQIRSIRHVRKYGVVGAPGWARAMIELSDFLSPVDAKTFDLGEEAKAWAWIETE